MKNISKLIIALVVIVAIYFGLRQVNFNRINTDSYYTKIVGEGKLLADNEDPKYNRYEYSLPAHTSKSKETLTFTTDKQLKQDSYIQLYVKDKEVTSYEERSWKDSPKAVQDKLGS